MAICKCGRYSMANDAKMCHECKRLKHNEYMRNYLRAKAAEKRHRAEKLREELWAKEARIKAATAAREAAMSEQEYLDSLPSHEDVFKPYFHDSGTGIDRGCSED